MCIYLLVILGCVSALLFSFCAFLLYFSGIFDLLCMYFSFFRHSHWSLCQKGASPHPKKAPALVSKMRWRDTPRCDWSPQKILIFLLSCHEAILGQCHKHPRPFVYVQMWNSLAAVDSVAVGGNNAFFPGSIWKQVWTKPQLIHGAVFLSPTWQHKVTRWNVIVNKGAGHWCCQCPYMDTYIVNIMG